MNLEVSVTFGARVFVLNGRGAAALTTNGLYPAEVGGV